jgi:catechol 2,3-dioxygenase-like lactoylglutathione lyase family enzyme
MALRYTHVSIPTRDAARAAQWYQNLFGLEELAAPNFGFPVRWFRIGDLQLHLYQRAEERAPMQHFGVPRRITDEAIRREDEFEQSDWNRSARIFLAPRAA